MSAFPTLRVARTDRLRLGRGIRAASFLLASALLASACGIPRPHLPEVHPTIPPLPQTSVLYDDQGRFITTLHAGEDRTLIPLSEVPFVTRDAVIAAEDERFYTHHGIDLKAIARAALADVGHQGIVQGGSTI